MSSDPDLRAGSASIWPRLMHELGPGFAARVSVHDADDSFVAENFNELRTSGVFAAAVPKALGGGDATYPELCDMLRTLAHYCGSTALALSMHTHALIAAAAWRWRRNPKPTETLLRRVASENLVVITSGGSDWLTASGTAERVQGGFRRSNAGKVFVNGLQNRRPADDAERPFTTIPRDFGPCCISPFRSQMLVSAAGRLVRAGACAALWSLDNAQYGRLLFQNPEFCLRRPAGRDRPGVSFEPGHDLPLPLARAVLIWGLPRRRTTSRSRPQQQTVYDHGLPLSRRRNAQ